MYNNQPARNTTKLQVEWNFKEGMYNIFSLNKIQKNPQWHSNSGGYMSTCHLGSPSSGSSLINYPTMIPRPRGPIYLIMFFITASRLLPKISRDYNTGKLRGTVNPTKFKAFLDTHKISTIKLWLISISLETVLSLSRKLITLQLFLAAIL